MVSTLKDHAETSNFEIPRSRPHSFDACIRDRPTPRRRTPAPTINWSISTNRLASRTTLAGIDLATRTTKPTTFLLVPSATKIVRSDPAKAQSSQDCSRLAPVGFRKTSGRASRWCSSSSSNSGVSDAISAGTAGRIETERVIGRAPIGAAGVGCDVIESNRPTAAAPKNGRGGRYVRGA
jgi:hypothetical protein